MFSWLTKQLLGDDTRDWPASQTGPLVLDLSARSLNNVKIGEPADRLRAFGRPAGKQPRRDRRFRYPARGVQIDIDPAGKVDEFHIFLASVGHEPDMRPNRCSIVLHGKSVDLAPGSKLADITAALPVTPKTETDDDEIIAKISVGPFDCDLTCDGAGVIEFIDFYDGR